MALKSLYILTLVFSCNICFGQLLQVSEEQTILSEYNWLFIENNNLKCGPSKSDIRESKVEECNFIDDFKMFPNPTDGSVTLKFHGKAQKTAIIISTLEGKAIYSEILDSFKGQYNNNIVIESKGVLIVSVIQEKEIFTKKLIVQ